MTLERSPVEWVSIVAHDLRQPAHAILLGTEILLDGTLDQHQRETIRRMRVSIDYLDRLLEDLTDAACIEAGRLPLRMRELELGALICEVVVPERRRRIHVQVPRSGATVRCDPDRTRQVLENLVSNAVKYGQPDTTIEIVVETLGAHALVTVLNRGPGIAADEIATVFERYGRSREAVAGPARGSGLGLFIAKGLVEAQGGRIWVESVPGERTMFRVMLPLAERASEVRELQVAR